MYECDNDFMPPLSQRRSTHQSDLSTSDVPDDDNDTDGVLAYFAEMSHQPTFVAYDDDGNVTGFLTYIPGYECDALDGVSDYITTICVPKRLRRQGIVSYLYQICELLHDNQDIPLSLRTWSTNTAQRALLERRGYDIVKIIKDNRGIGIDTIYYMRQFCNFL